MMSTAYQELRDQVEVIESWLRKHTQMDPSRVRLSVLGVMLWLAKEAELQGKSWWWTLEHSRVHLASKQCWQLATRKVRGRVRADCAQEEELRSLDLPRNDNSRLAHRVLLDLERGYGLSAKHISRILRRASVGPAEVSPERARSHCLGRPQKRGQSNPKWNFIVPPPLSGPNKDQLMLPSVEP